MLGRRQEKRRTEWFTDDGTASHHKCSAAEAANHLYRMAMLPQVSYTNIRMTDPRMREFAAQLLSRGDSPCPVNINVSAPELWHIPERLVGLF